MNLSSTSRGPTRWTPLSQLEPVPEPVPEPVQQSVQESAPDTAPKIAQDTVPETAQRRRTRIRQGAIQEVRPYFCAKLTVGFFVFIC